MDADLELASALCSYHGPEGTRASRIDGLLVDTRLASLLHTAERRPRGAVPGHTPVCFDLHLRGMSQRVVKFVRPKPVVPAQREEHERLLLVQGLLDPLEARWRAALSAGDVDRAWALWTTTAEETLLALACLDITPDSLPAGATLPPPRQGHGQAAPGGAPLPQATMGHRRAANLPGGAHPGGLGASPGRPTLAGTTNARCERVAARGGAGVGGSPVSPGQAPCARPGVCGL